MLPYSVLPELVDVIEARWKAHEALKKQNVICPWVFNRGGEPIRDFRRAWRNACEAAGCPGRITHDFRRTAVRNFERAGISRSVAMKVTVHLTESIYKRYAIVSEGDIRDGLAKLNAPAQAPTTQKKAKIRRLRSVG